MDDAAQRPDPYLLWAAATGFRDVVREPRDKALAVAVECQGSVADFVAATARFSGIEVAGRYRTAGVVDPATLQHCTALVTEAALPELQHRVRRLKLGMAVAGHGAGAPKPPQRCRTKVVIGLIDDFVAYAHPRLRDAAGTSRVRHVWSQDAQPPRGAAAACWQPCADFPYGHELDTLACSRNGIALQHTYPGVLKRFTHGTHVADLAAGALPRHDEPAAPDLVAVHLPRRAIADTSGSALKMQVLDALHYIVERAGAEATVVVNLSLGTMAGPHDGQSILEQAIDALVAQRAGKLAVVVPAGNGREARCHAQVRLSRSEPSAELRWLVQPDDATPSWLELWLPPTAGRAVAVHVTDPSGRIRLSCRRGEQQLAPPAGDPVCGVFYLDQVADSDQGTMVLVAVAPTTSRRGGAAVAPAGIWRVGLEHDGRAGPVEIRAWIERDETPRGEPTRGRQSAFVDPLYPRPRQQPGPTPDSALAQVKRDGAFNPIATGVSTYVAGGYVGGHVAGGRLATYSGCGPTRSSARPGPTLLACSEQSPTEPGQRGAGTFGVSTVRMNGTGVAAPQLTREVANILADRGSAASKDPAATVQQRLAGRLIEGAPGGARPMPDLLRVGLGRLRPRGDARAVAPTSAPAARAAAPSGRPRRAGNRR